MGPRIFAALGDRGGPTICRLNTAGETRPLVSSSSPLLLFSSLGLFPRENRARFRGDIIWISWRTRLKKSRFFEKSRTDRIPTEFELCQTNRRSIGLERLSARGPNVKCPWPNVEPLCLAVVKEFGVWLLLVRCKLSGRVPPRINPVLRFLGRVSFQRYLRETGSIESLEYFAKEGRFDRLFQTRTHKKDKLR